MSDYISKKDVLNILYNTFDEYSMATDKQDKLGGFGAEVFKRVKEQPTLDEKEIIRKAFERVVAKLESELKWTRAEQSIECERTNGYGSPLQSKNSGKIESLKKAIEIVKEECGISE